MKLYLYGNCQVLNETLWEALASRGYDVALTGDTSQVTRIVLTAGEPVLILAYVTTATLSEVVAIDRLIRVSTSPHPVRLLAVCADPTLATDLMQLGARPDALLLASAGLGEIAFGIAELNRGVSYVSAALKGLLAQPLTGAASAAHPSLSVSHLTKREREVMRHIAEATTAGIIARKLFISVATVNNHKANIMEKLNLTGHHTLLSTAITLKPWLDLSR